ncbi:hypothetical protein Godav_025590 [Gossypium davidsonii]|uniref:Uncharacterized protein n=1 Tax=Gossypium davidsonii TaxID=34287 RepID=A0A7J8TAX7_GOSDV|nr:hypothetical protein [Gossypium davidsonii]
MWWLRHKETLVAEPMGIRGQSLGSGNDSFGSRFSVLNQVGDLGSDLKVANGDFSREKVRERGAVGDGGLKIRANIGVKKNSRPKFEAGRGSATGHGALLGPAKNISLLKIWARNLILVWINFWAKVLWNWRKMSVEKPGLVLVSSSGADKSGFTDRKGGIKSNKNRVAVRIQMLFGDEGVVLNLLTRVSGAKADSIIAKLGFQFSH